MPLMAGYLGILTNSFLFSFASHATSSTAANECYPQDLPISDSTHTYLSARSLTELSHPPLFHSGKTALEVVAHSEQRSTTE